MSSNEQLGSAMRYAPGSEPQSGTSARKRPSGCCMGCLRRSPFFLAVEEGDADEVARFLREDPLWLKHTDGKEKQTAWHLAAEGGHTEVLHVLAARTREDDVGALWGSLSVVSLTSRIMLLSREPPGPEERVAELVNCRSTWGVTPLALAAIFEHEEALRYLLSIGADPWLGDQDGRNTAHYAAKAGAVRSLQVLFEEERPYSSRACNNNRPSTRYVDCLDAFGFTPLHYATWANKRAAMMTLIGFDANIIARSLVGLMLHTDYYNLPAGSTPLHIACLLGCLDRVKLLLRAYYETAADLLPSQTALLATVERRRRARSHPDPRLILTRTQRLPFHLAARCGHRLLLDWLDPSVPLMFLFGGEEEEGSATGPDGSRVGGNVALVGVSRLTVIAAKALHQALLASLDVAAEDIRRHEEAEQARREERRRRREERRTAREAEAAAQSLKQGKEPPPDGFRGKFRKLMDRTSKDLSKVGTSSGGGGAINAAGGAADGAGGGDGGGSKGWRPWRGRGRRGGRRKAAAAADGAGGAAGGGDDDERPSAPLRSPHRRRRTGSEAAAAAPSMRGGARAAAAAAAAVPSTGGGTDGAAGGAAGCSSEESGDDGSSCSSSSDGRQRQLGGAGERRQGQRQRAQRSLRTAPPVQAISPVGSLRRSGADDGFPDPSPPLQTRRASLNMGGHAATGDSTITDMVAAGGVSGGGGNGTGGNSLTRSVLQRLYPASLRRRVSGGVPAAVARAEAQAQAQVMGRLNRVGITIPEGPDEAVAFFSPGREPRYNMPTQIVLPGVSPAGSPTAAAASASAAVAVAASSPLAGGEAARSLAAAEPPAPDAEAGASTAPSVGAQGTPVGSGDGAAADTAGDAAAAAGGDGSAVGAAGAGTAPTLLTALFRRSDGGGDGEHGDGQGLGCSAAATAGSTDAPVSAAATDASPVLTDKPTEQVAGSQLGGTTTAVSEPGGRMLGTGLRSSQEGAAGVPTAAAAAAATAAQSSPLHPHGHAVHLPPLPLPPSLSATAAAAAAASDGSTHSRKSQRLTLGAGGPHAQAASSTAAPATLSQPGPTGGATEDVGSAGAQPAAAPARCQSADQAAGAPPPTTTTSQPADEAAAVAATAASGHPPTPAPVGQAADGAAAAAAAGGTDALLSSPALQPPSAPLAPLLIREPAIRSPDSSCVASPAGGPYGPADLPGALAPPPASTPHPMAGTRAADGTRGRLSSSGSSRGGGDGDGEDGGGERASRGRRSSVQLPEGLPQLRDQEATEIREGGGDSTVTVTGVPPAQEPSWRRSLDVGRVGAGARLLLNSLKNTLRKSTAQRQAQVHPLGATAPRSLSPGRFQRRRRTALGVAAGADGADAAATTPLLAAATPGSPASPCSHAAQHHRGGTGRGVRVTSAHRPRLSFLGRTSVASTLSADAGAPGGADAAAAAGGGAAPSDGGTRRRGRTSALSRPSRRQPGPLSGRQGDSPSRARDSGVASEAEGEGPARAGDAQREQPAVTAVGGSNRKVGEPQSGPGLRAGECSSFSSSSSSGDSVGSGQDGSKRPAGHAGATGGTATAHGGAGAGGNDSSDEDVCPVCLDESPNLLVQTCRHQICMNCARDLVKRHSLTPALCPYCRGIISSFKACVAAIAAGEGSRRGGSGGR